MNKKHPKNCKHCSSIRGKIPWNKGLTKETSDSVKKISVSLTGKKLSPQHIENVRKSRTGFKHTEENRKYLGDILTKSGIKTRFKKGENVSEGTQFKKGQIPWNKGKPMYKIRGENHPNWKGGNDSENAKIRKSLEYKLWRNAVFQRDKHTCIWCFDNSGGNLQADHIKPFALYPELRFAIDNGRTLCVSCHKKTDTYAGKGFKRIKK